MKAKARAKKTSPIGAVISNITSFLSRGWCLIAKPSDARCEAYTEEERLARERMGKENISYFERHFWKRRMDKAQDGLRDVQEQNSSTFIKAICAVGAGLFIGYKLFKK